jgi:hypothetical protein
MPWRKRQIRRTTRRTERRKNAPDANDRKRMADHEAWRMTLTPKERKQFDADGTIPDRMGGMPGRKNRTSTPFDNKITEEKGVDGKTYKVMNGTWYHHETDESMVRLLEQLRNDRTRVRFHWGDAKTGLDWGEDLDIRGRIGRSMGPIKVPLLLNTAKSIGGDMIDSDGIVMIESSPKGQVYYKHPNYHQR